MGPHSRALLQSLHARPTCRTTPSRSAPRRSSTSATPGCAPAASPTSASSAGSCTSRPSSPPACSTRSSMPARPFGLRHAGYHALNSLRMEKGYRHWGHDITPGRDAARGRPRLRASRGTSRAVSSAATRSLAQKEAGRAPAPRPVRARRPRQAALPQRADLARRRHRRHASRRACTATPSTLRSAWDRCRGPMAVAPDATTCSSGRYEIEVAGERVPARVSLEPWYDPKSTRVRS